MSPASFVSLSREVAALYRCRARRHLQAWAMGAEDDQDQAAHMTRTSHHARPGIVQLAKVHSPEVSCSTQQALSFWVGKAPCP